MSIWIARLLGPVFLAVAFPMITSPQTIGALAGDFLKSRALIFVTGVLVLVGGLAIVNTHNYWVFGWPVIITAFGWAMIIGGALRVMMPGFVAKAGRAMTSSSVATIATRISGVVWAGLGALLMYKGYF